MNRSACHFSRPPTWRTLGDTMNPDAPRLTPGTLWPAILERTQEARRCGAIQSIATTSETIEQDGIAFQVRLVQALVQKAEAQTAQLRVDPFLPHDPELFVADVSPTHFALLNKFNVLDHHLLIVTRAFEDQETLLTLADCHAMLTGLAEFDGLAFYNAGPLAGASQPHKHLQMIPLASANGPRLPIEPLVSSAQAAGAVGTVPGLPFLHSYAPMRPEWLTTGRRGAEAVRLCYRSLLDRVGLPVEPAIGDRERTGPYNLLVTRRWLMLVPRTKEYFEGMSVNALGFAGLLLAKDASQMEMIRARGPMTALRHVTSPGWS